MHEVEIGDCRPAEVVCVEVALMEWILFVSWRLPCWSWKSLCFEIGVDSMD